MLANVIFFSFGVLWIGISYYCFHKNSTGDNGFLGLDATPGTCIKSAYSWFIISMLFSPLGYWLLRRMRKEKTIKMFVAGWSIISLLAWAYSAFWVN